MSEGTSTSSVPHAEAAVPLGRRARQLRFAGAVVLVALGASAFAIAFRSALALTFQSFANSADVVAAMERLPIWARLCLPACGGLLAGSLGLIVARSAQGHGVADVMEAVVLGRVRVSLRVTLLKSLASWCAIAAGGRSVARAR